MIINAHLGQLLDVIGVEQELLQAAGIAQDLFGHGGQRTVALIDKFHLTIAALEYWNALEHVVVVVVAVDVTDFNWCFVVGFLLLVFCCCRYG